MKHIIFIITFLVVTITAAQEPEPDRLLARSFINKAIEITDAVIVREVDLEEEEYITLVTSAPEHFDIKLVVATFNHLVDNYENVTYYENWKQTEGYYRAFIWVNEHLVLTTWHPRSKKINYSY